MHIIVPLILLAVGLLAVLGFLRTTANKAETRRTAHQLQHSVATFFTEYSRFPTRDTASADEAIHFSDNRLMAVLAGAEPDAKGSLLNPRQIPFYGFKRRESATHPVGTYEIFDAWGNHYRVIMDTNGHDQITPPAWTGLKDPIRKSVIVWSPGPDGKDETAKDNIISW